MVLINNNYKTYLILLLFIEDKMMNFIFIKYLF